MGEKEEIIQGGVGLVENQDLWSFPTKDPIELCSWNLCSSGHKWKPTVAITDCPGCQGPILLVRMENCPYCNEPVEKFSLRADHIVKGVSKRCHGEKVAGESSDIEMTRSHEVEHEGKEPGCGDNSCRNGVDVGVASNC